MCFLPDPSCDFFKRIGVSRQCAALKHTPEATRSKWCDTDARNPRQMPDELLRPEDAAKLFPHIRMTATGLRTEAKQGRRAIRRIAGLPGPLDIPRPPTAKCYERPCGRVGWR
jgi:hypothetical protein